MGSLRNNEFFGLTSFLRMVLGLAFLGILFFKLFALISWGVSGIVLFLFLLAVGSGYTLHHLIRLCVGEEPASGADMAESRSVEDRLDELERLKRREMVTPEEYAAKRQEILKDL